MSAKMGPGDYALAERAAFDALDRAYRTGQRTLIRAATVLWAKAAEARRLYGD